MKEVEVFGPIMANSVGYQSTRYCIALVLIVCFMLQSFANVSQAEVKSFNENWSEDITVNGGRTLLVEELSATWCTSCAEIDPYLQQVADAHGSRISIVTYHPTDGEDAFQPAAAHHRIERMKLVNDEIGATPSFVVESGQLRIGPNSWPDVQKDILKAETNRQDVSELSFTISQKGGNYSATISSSKLRNVTDETQLTFLLMRHEVEMPDGFFNPGEDHRDRVVVATSSCNVETSSIENIGFIEASTTDCLNDYTVKFPIDGKFSLVLIHEFTDEVIESRPNLASTLGVVEFAYRDIEIDNETNLMPIVFVSTIVIGFLWVMIGRNSN